MQPLGLLADHIVCTVTSIQLGITLVMGLYLKAQANLDEGTTTKAHDKLADMLLQLMFALTAYSYRPPVCRA